jgi:hypothetical protein
MCRHCFRQSNLALAYGQHIPSIPHRGIITVSRTQTRGKWNNGDSHSLRGRGDGIIGTHYNEDKY